MSDKKNLKAFFEAKEPKSKKLITSFRLTERYYEQFKLYCENRDATTGEVLDLMIKDFVLDHESEIKKIKK